MLWYRSTSISSTLRARIIFAASFSVVPLLWCCLSAPEAGILELDIIFTIEWAGYFWTLITKKSEREEGKNNDCVLWKRRKKNTQTQTTTHTPRIRSNIPFLLCGCRDPIIGTRSIFRWLKQRTSRNNYFGDLSQSFVARQWLARLPFKAQYHAASTVSLFLFPSLLILFNGNVSSRSNQAVHYYCCRFWWLWK